MQLMNEIPDTFWSLFRSVNRDIYIEALLWVNSENVVVGTWRPNVTYLPAEEDMTWKFTGTFEPSCIL